MSKLKTPIVFIIFNRSETTKKVFEEIRKAKPEKLYIIADGPRKQAPQDVELCNRTRKIVEDIDWDCDIIKDYSDENLGCKVRPSGGFDIVFKQEEEAIILEDDCLPHPSFFEFCQELLERYRYEEKINIISGSNFLSKFSNKNYHYQFSTFHHFWGWATWRRSWEKYDIEMKEWPKIRDSNTLSKIFQRKQSVRYWQTLFDEVYSGKINTAWDYQWLYSSWKDNGLAILPTNNLISNIGFGENATHTTNKKHIRSNVPLEGVPFPLIHPPAIKRDLEYDRILAHRIFSFKGKARLIRTVKKLLKF